MKTLHFYITLKHFHSCGQYGVIVFVLPNEDSCYEQAQRILRNNAIDQQINQNSSYFSPQIFRHIAKREGNSVSSYCEANISIPDVRCNLFSLLCLSGCRTLFLYKIYQYTHRSLIHTPSLSVSLTTTTTSRTMLGESDIRVINIY